MPNKFTKTLLLAVFCFLSSPVVAGDIKKGKKLYDASCNGCHDTRIHTRINRIVHTYGDLANRVKFCDNASKSGFNEAQLADVTEYLNSAFYKFIKE